MAWGPWRPEERSRPQGEPLLGKGGSQESLARRGASALLETRTLALAGKRIAGLAILSLLDELVAFENQSMIAGSTPELQGRADVVL